MCHPFVTSPFSNPSQQALPLCDCCYAWGLPQHWVCVLCVCIYARVCVHMCVVALTNLFIPWPPCLHWWWWWRWRGREEGLLKDSPPFPLTSRLQPTAPQPSWHLPPDRLNELKEIQWDTWCSSQGVPLLLYRSAPLCPQAQAQRRAHLGQSKRSKNTQYATVYQNLSSSPNTNPPFHLPIIPTHLSADLSSTSLALLLLYPFWMLALLIDRAEEMKYKDREWRGICTI